MKIKEGFVAREIAGQSVVIAVGAASKIFNGIIKLNETGKIIWTKLSEGVGKEETVDAILAEYEIDRATSPSTNTTQCGLPIETTLMLYSLSAILIFRSITLSPSRLTGIFEGESTGVPILTVTAPIFPLLPPKRSP